MLTKKDFAGMVYETPAILHVLVRKSNDDTYVISEKMRRLLEERGLLENGVLSAELKRDVLRYTTYNPEKQEVSINL
ncbi:MAG: hypothetical protein PHT40_01235 [Patescibacteria group bacterium]|nr:hypothetical protein [Patescibacteria group bacterium]